jgi:hypothetical protein
MFYDLAAGLLNVGEKDYGISVLPAVVSPLEILLYNLMIRTLTNVWHPLKLEICDLLLYFR